MYARHYHTPASTRARCPVCHEAVYSCAGIHPQCAIKLSDPPRPKPRPPTPAGQGDLAAAVQAGAACCTHRGTERDLVEVVVAEDVIARDAEGTTLVDDVRSGEVAAVD